MAYRAVEIANQFLSLPDVDGLTQMQLQKLVYFANGWNLALSGTPLVSESPQAWDYGPVYADLYDHTKFFGSKKIERQITPDDDEAIRFFLDSPSGRSPYLAQLDSRERSIIDHVWRRYGKMSGPRLSALTHQPNTPWFITYKEKGKSAQIDQILIQNHYDGLASLAQKAA
jgi:uncharacterized phage-associated protein